jgi:hypothetical protein
MHHSFAARDSIAMFRHAITLTSACLMLSACQREAAPEAADTAVAPAVETSTASAAASPAAAPSTAIAPIVVEPFGIESCDAFVAAINRCFATSKAHPSAAQILRPSYEQEIQRWRRMMEEPAMATGVETLCKTQMDSMSHTREGLQCE